MPMLIAHLSLAADCSLSQNVILIIEAAKFTDLTRLNLKIA